MNQENSKNAKDDKDITAEKMKYKAAKYHYKIQKYLIDNYVSQNKDVPMGYEKYLKPFE